MMLIQSLEAHGAHVPIFPFNNGNNDQIVNVKSNAVIETFYRLYDDNV